MPGAKANRFGSIRLRSLCAALLISANAGAAPADWFLWQSAIDGAVTCKQTSPGRGWKKVAGPYTDLRCSKPVQSPSHPGATAQP